MFYLNSYIEPSVRFMSSFCSKLLLLSLFKLLTSILSVEECWKEEPAADPADTRSCARLEERRTSARQRQWQRSCPVAHQEKEEKKKKDQTSWDVRRAWGEWWLRSECQGGEHWNEKEEERQQIWWVLNLLWLISSVLIVFCTWRPKGVLIWTLCHLLA